MLNHKPTPSAILVHGFNDRSAGADNIDQLAPFLEVLGYKTMTHAMDYGWRGLLGVRFRNGKTAARLVDIAGPDDIVIGYSNGCEIIARAIQRGLKARRVIFIHPALASDWVPPSGAHVECIDVYYSARDKATWHAGLIHSRWNPVNWLLGGHGWATTD